MREVAGGSLGEKLAKNYRSFTPQERPAVIETLRAFQSGCTTPLDFFGKY